MQKKVRILFSALPALLLALSVCPDAFAQAFGEGTASIGGSAIVDGKPAADVIFVLTATYTDSRRLVQQLTQGKTVVRTKTDSSGHYRFDGLAAGRYQINPMTATLVQTDSKYTTNGVSVADGDTVDGIDFMFTRGGAINGMVVSSDGRPMIGVTVSVSAVPATNAARPAAAAGGVVSADGGQLISTAGTVAETDDRGIFRAYGLTAGKYYVSVAAHSAGRGAYFGPTIAAETFFPGVTDKTAAGVVELTAGGESGGIDIKVGAAPQGYEVTGRIIDDSGRGVPDVMVSYGAIGPGGGGRGSGIGPFTDSKGNFKIEHVLPGSYSAVASFSDQLDSSLYGETAKFDVGDGNLSGIELKVHQGLTVSGTAVIEGTDDPQATAKLPELQLFGMSDSTTNNAFGMSRSPVGQDGSFTLKGLPPGKVRIQVLDFFTSQNFQMLRIEQNGSPISQGIDLPPGQSVSGIRVVLGFANCSVTGQVTIQGGKLPPSAVLYVAAKPLGQQVANPAIVMDDSGGGGGGEMIEVDPAGHFRIDHLLPGDYQITVSAMVPPAPGSNKPGNIEVSQNVTLSSGGEAQLSFALDASSIPGQSN